MEKTFESGALIDERPVEEKEKDFTFDEIVSEAQAVDWREKSEDELRAFPIFNQDGSGSCVAQTAAKMLGILYWLRNRTYVHFSATHIYQRRVNKPSGGMIGVDCMNILRDGATLEELVPSQDMNDREMDAIDIPQYKKDVGSVFKISNYVTLPIRDIDTVASTIQKTGKPVMVWFYFTHAEWGRDVPVIQDHNLDIRTASRHSVTAVDYTLHNGKKALIIEDSWGPGTGRGGRRIVTEDFFKERNFFTAYAIDFKFEEQPISNKPRHTFNRDLEFKAEYHTDSEVVALQECLKYTGHFPTNVESTGYFGAITKKSVQKFQEAYDIASAGDLGYGRVGPKTRAQLNQLFGQ